MNTFMKTAILTVSTALFSVPAHAIDHAESAQRLLDYAERFENEVRNTEYDLDSVVEQERRQFKLLIQEATNQINQIEKPEARAALEDLRNYVVSEAIAIAAFSTDGVNERFPLLTFAEALRLTADFRPSSTVTPFIQILSAMVASQKDRIVEEDRTLPVREEDMNSRQLKIDAAVKQVRAELELIKEAVNQLDRIKMPKTSFTLRNLYALTYRDSLAHFHVKQPDVDHDMHTAPGEEYFSLAELLPYLDKDNGIR